MLVVSEGFVDAMASCASMEVAVSVLEHFAPFGLRDDRGTTGKKTGGEGEGAAAKGAVTRQAGRRQAA